MGDFSVSASTWTKKKFSRGSGKIPWRMVILWRNGIFFVIFLIMFFFFMAGREIGHPLFNNRFGYFVKEEEAGLLGIIAQQESGAGNQMTVEQHMTPALINVIFRRSC